MSLINEALKRAEAEKNRDIGGLPYRPPAVPHAHHVRLPRRWARGLALCCGLVAVTALGMWTMVDKSFWPPALKAEAANTAADPAPAQAPPDPRPQVRQEIDPVLAKTMEETKYYSPAPKPVAARPAHVRPADAAPPAVATTPRPAPAPAPAPVKREQPKLPDLKLSGVLVSPGGGTAIINGQFLAVGDTIEGARIVKITKYVVTLEMNGQRITLRQ